MPRHNRLKKIRERKAVAQDYKCFYCDTSMTEQQPGRGNNKKTSACTIEHLRQTANGGKKYNTDNIVAACMGCNSTRGDTHWTTWFRMKHPKFKIEEGNI